MSNETQISGGDGLAQVREKSTSSGQAHAPTDDTSTHPHLNVMTDDTCPLKDTLGHVCRNRDHIEREAFGLPALRPGSTCHVGANYARSAERDAQQAAVALSRQVPHLTAALRELGYGDLDFLEEADTLALLMQLTGSVAGWHKVAS